MNTNRWGVSLGFIGVRFFPGSSDVPTISDIKAAVAAVRSRVVCATTVEAPSESTNKKAIANLRAAGFKPFAKGARSGGEGEITLWRKRCVFKKIPRVDSESDARETFCCGLRIAQVDCWYTPSLSVMRIYGNRKPCPKALPEGFKVLALARGFWVTAKPVKEK